MAGRLAGERRIVIAAYDGISLLDLSGPLAAFSIASKFACDRCLRLDYKCSVVSSRGGKIKTADGVTLLTDPIRTLDRTTIDTQPARLLAIFIVDAADEPLTTPDN